MLTSGHASSRRPLPRRRPAAVILWIALCLAVAVGLIGVGLWYVRVYNRPGPAAYRQGEADAAAGRDAQARQDFLTGIQRDPSFASCYVALGDLEARMQQYGLAGQHYAAAASLLPQDGALALKIAGNDLKLGDEADAYTAAKRAAALMPNDAAALAQYGYLEGQKQGYPKAIAALRRAVQITPDNPKFLLALVYVEIEAYDMTQAEADLMPYLKAHPQDAKANYEAAAIWSEKPATPQNVRQGLAYAQRALEGGLGNARLLGIFGRFYLQENQTARALQAYEAALRINPNDDEALHGRLVCDTRLGNIAAAARDAVRFQAVSERHQRIKVLQIVNRRNPSDIASALELANLEEEDGYLDVAQQLFARYVQMFPDDPRTRAALAAFYRRHGRPDLARQSAAPGSVP